jgi:pyruvate dehydrogenase E2 component (dihydrolipoyllysine-residue acetyltransferase)
MATAVPVTMPMLGLTMEEGTVAEWLKAEGEAVRKDEPLLTVEMDKGTVEVPAPTAGVLRRILVQPGTTVAVKTPIAEIETETGGSAPASAPATPAGGKADLPSQMPEPRPVSVAAVSGGLVARSTQDGVGQRTFVSPRARMRARELGIDLVNVRGSGPHGRIVEADVLAAREVTTEQRVLATPLARRLASEHGVDIGALVGSGPGGRITQDDVLRAAQPSDVQQLSRIRRITAERMAASAQATARVTLFLEADFTEAARFRQQLQPEFARLGVPKLPWDAVLAKAVGLALLEHPAVHGQWVEGSGIRGSSSVNVGVAVALEPEGLVVPVVRDAHARSLRELASDLLQLVDKARAGRLGVEDMQAGTFTITNLGAYRIDGFTPIINPPETAILGVGRIAEKAVVIDGRIEPRTMCTLSLSFDHRVVDGAPAAAFLARLAELIERPYALLGI